MKTFTPTTIFVFAALLVALPMTSSNVFAQVESTGTATLAESCGFKVPPALNLGTLDAGSDGDELLVTIETTGTKIATLSVTATDWTGTDDIVHLEASNTKYKITTGTDTISESTYAEKSNFAEKDIVLQLTATLTPANSATMYLQISADGDLLKEMPYSGTLSQTLTFTSDCA